MSDPADPADCADAPGRAPFPYEGDPALRGPLIEALGRVFDPEVGLSILDVGLVYGLSAVDGQVRLRLTMTSPACPLADAILDDIDRAFDAVLPADAQVAYELTYEPPWTSDRMSPVARAVMGW